MHNVVHERAQSHIGVSSYLEFGDPGVISKASITEPVDKVIGATLFGNESYSDTRLKRKKLHQHRK
jgi:hypothetical protein